MNIFFISFGKVTAQLSYFLGLKVPRQKPTNTWRPSFGNSNQSILTTFSIPLIIWAGDTYITQMVLFSENVAKTFISNPRSTSAIWKKLWLKLVLRLIKFTKLIRTFLWVSKIESQRPNEIEGGKKGLIRLQVNRVSVRKDGLPLDFSEMKNNIWETFYLSSFQLCRCRKRTWCYFFILRYYAVYIPINTHS